MWTYSIAILQSKFVKTACAPESTDWVLSYIYTYIYIYMYIYTYTFS